MSNRSKVSLLHLRFKCFEITTLSTLLPLEDVVCLPMTVHSTHEFGHIKQGNTLLIDGPQALYLLIFDLSTSGSCITTRICSEPYVLLSGHQLHLEP
jgi:hypothetical protein